MEAFINLQVVKARNQTKELPTIYDQLEATVRNLKSFNVKGEHVFFPKKKTKL